MRVGVFYFPTDYGIDIRELARAAEERGFESLFLPEHTHIPKSRRTPFPGGGELPKAYSHYARPVRRAVVCRRCDKKNPTRYRHLSNPTARPDRDGKVRGQSGPVVRWPLHFRHWRRLECR